MLHVFIPSLMRKLTNDKHIVEINASSITELINKLDNLIKNPNNNPKILFEF